MRHKNNTRNCMYIITTVHVDEKPMQHAKTTIYFKVVGAWHFIFNITSQTSVAALQTQVLTSP